MSEVYQKKELLALMSTGANKLCVDCNAPSPQWASVSFGTFICLECSGVHRGFGVHISFVRSITMDKWSEDQLKKMRLGGNEAFKSFMENYGADGGYNKSMGMIEKYNSWAATQYREKLAAACADPPTPWSPSPAPPPTSRPTSAQATRKSRAGGAPSSLNPSRSASPYTDGPSPVSGPGSGHEAFFERMGNANASRPENLPPSQGGRYAGFGSAPSPDSPSGNSNNVHPSFALSSQNLPTLTDIQTNPLGAVKKGWGLFSSALAVASKEINESVLQPGLAKASEVSSGEGSEEWKKYLAGVGGKAQEVGGWVTERAGEGWKGVNEVAKTKGGVDLNEQFGKLGLGGIVGTGTKQSSNAGYGQVGHTGTNNGGDDDFFEAWDEPTNTSSVSSAPTSATSISGRSQIQGQILQPKAKVVKKNDGWGDDDGWKDF